MVIPEDRSEAWLAEVFEVLKILSTANPFRIQDCRNFLELGNRRRFGSLLEQRRAEDVEEDEGVGVVVGVNKGKDSLEQSSVLSLRATAIWSPWDVDVGVGVGRDIGLDVDLGKDPLELPSALSLRATVIGSPWARQ